MKGSVLARGRQFGSAFGFLVGGGTLVGAALVVLSSLWPNSPVAAQVGLSSIRESRATAWLNTSNPTIQARSAAKRETVLSLRESVANPTPWLRLAFLDSLDTGDLSDDGVRMLAQSYAVAPLGPDNTRWRLAFAFDHWDRLDEPLRRHVSDEVATVAATKPWVLNDIADEVSNPSGVFAARLFAAQADHFGQARQMNRRRAMVQVEP